MDDADEATAGDRVHALDHTVFRCAGMPGGRREHLRLRWRLHTSRRLRAATLCRLGAHRYVEVYLREPGTPPTELWLTCDACGRHQPRPAGHQE